MSQNTRLWASKIENVNDDEDEELINKPNIPLIKNKPQFERTLETAETIDQNMILNKQKYGELLYQQWKQNKNLKELSLIEPKDEITNFESSMESTPKPKSPIETKNIAHKTEEEISNDLERIQIRKTKLMEIEEKLKNLQLTKTNMAQDDLKINKSNSRSGSYITNKPESLRRCGSTDDVFNRLFDRGKQMQLQKDIKKRIFEEQREKKDMEHCNFSPKVDHKSNLIAKHLLPRNKKIGETLYNDFEARQNRAKEMQKNTDLNIKYKSSIPKTNKLSEELAFNKLEKDLEQAMQAVNCTIENKINFHELGVFLYNIGIFKILFNPQYNITVDQNGEYISVKDIIVTHIQTYNKMDQRKTQERKFLLNLWGMLSRNEYSEYNNRSLVLEVFKMVYDPTIISQSEMVNVISRLLDTAFKIIQDNRSDIEKKIQNYISPRERNVELWNALNDTKLTGLKSNFLKANKLIKYVNAGYKFEPQIDDKSRKLADRQMDKIKQEILEGESTYFSPHGSTQFRDSSKTEESEKNINSSKNHKNSENIKDTKSLKYVPGQRSLRKNSYPESSIKSEELEVFSKKYPKSLQSSRSEKQLLTKFIGHPAPNDEQLSIKRYDLLYQKHFTKQMNIEIKKREKIAKEVSGCNFHPEINKNKHLRQIDMERVPIWEQEIKSKELPLGYKTKLDKDLEQCTFHPTLVSKKKETGIDRPIAGYQKTVDRFRNAAIHKAKKKVEIEKMGKVSKKYAQNKNPCMKPFSFDSRVKIEREPLIYLDINLGKGKSGRIAIYENDQPSVIASNFCKTYQLNERAKETLEGLIVAQVQNYFEQENIKFQPPFITDDNEI